MVQIVRSERRAERTLVSRARRGDVEALRALLNRFSSLVWAACTLSTPDHPVAVAVFHECWDRIFTLLTQSNLDPDLAGMVIGHCRRRLLETASPEPVEKALASAMQLTSAGEAVVHVPPEAIGPVGDLLDRHAERLAQDTFQVRARRHRGLVLPLGLLVAIIGGLVIARVGASGSGVGDDVAQAVRARVIEGDLVPLYRDCVSPPFSVSERDAVETRGLEQVALVLEELANTPPEVTGEQVIHLKRRVNSQDLVDFVVGRSERTSGDDRDVLLSVGLILEEIANL